MSTLCPAWRTPPSSPQPSASTSISCDNLQTVDQLASLPAPPHAQASARPQPCPAPHPGPSCRRPRQSVIPLALLSALGRSGQIKPLSHTPRKAQGQMGQDKWCQIIDPLLAGTQGRAPTTTPHMAVGGGQGAQGGGGNMEERHTPQLPLGLEPMQGTLVRPLDDQTATPPLSWNCSAWLLDHTLSCAHRPCQLCAPGGGAESSPSQCPSAPHKACGC